MDNALKGLFGGGDGDDDGGGTDRARDFVKRYSEGPKDQGYEAEEAVSQLNKVLPHASSDQVERATRQALNDVPEDQRSQFGDFVKQLQGRDGSDRSATGGGGSGGFSMDDISGMLGKSGGSANSVDDLLGGLMGGGGASKSSGGGVGNVLGGLFGGGDTDNRSSGSGGGGAGGFLSSGVGKMVLGGIAAYLTKEMLDRR